MALKYYAKKRKEGLPFDLIVQFENESPPEGMEEITRFEYILYGGDPTIEVAFQEKRTAAKINALQFYQEFIEDCIAEMAMVLYSE